MSTTVTYLFDPLCGWCYGASPTIQKLGRESTLTLQLVPTGLFAGSGRTMDAAFADYAWSNDLRIEKITGQPFTEMYRTQVLGNLGGSFDSAAATLALTAVSLTEPVRELEALKRLQEARYVQGLDTSAALVVDTLLRDAGLVQAANMLASPSHDVVSANAARIEHAQRLMQAHGAHGVPALIVTNAQGRRLLRGDALYGSFDDLLKAIAL
jgi:putative protein-disulfide isomerase